MSAACVPAAEQDPDRQLYRLSSVLQAAGAIGAAAHLGILDHLYGMTRTADEVTRQCGTAPGATALLLDALEALGVLQRGADGRYTATTAARELRTFFAGWSRLDQVVRTGQPLVPADTPDGAADLYPEVVPLLSRLFAAAAQRVAELLAPIPGDVLDVGAGAAPWSIALAHADPTARVTALDLPHVLSTTRRMVEAAGRIAQFQFRAGDMFTVDLPPAAYDIILLGNVCHLYSQDVNRALLKRLRPALRPGGTLAIIDALPSEDPEAHQFLSLYALGLRLRTSAGTVHPLEAYASWTRATGYGQLTVTALSQTPPLALLTCTVCGIGASAPRTVATAHQGWS